MSLLSLKGVSKIYKVDKTSFCALKNINILFPDRGLVSVIGKSGSGKSTLLNLLMGIEKPTSGDISFYKRTINKMSKREFSSLHLSYISMIYQHYNLFDNLTPLENVILPLLIRGEKRKKAENIALNLFNKFSLNYLLDQKTSTLSGGEKQRISLLRSLIINPKVILADEPTGALDSKNGILVMELLKKISEDILVIMVSHNLEFVKSYSDRLIELKDGEIVSDSSPFMLRPVVEDKSLKYKYSSSWKKLFLKKNFKDDLGKNIFSFLAATFGFISIMLSIGFSIGSKESEDLAIKANLAIGTAFLYQETLYEIDNSPLNYIKKSRPSLEKVDELISNRIDGLILPNYDYLFSKYPEIIYERETIDRAEFMPIYDFSSDLYSDLLTYGRYPTNNLLEVVTNEEFASTLDKDFSKVIDSSIVISATSEVSYFTDDIDNQIIKDKFQYSYEMKIVGIVKEFSFLNNPKIYYSYPSLEEELKNTRMENLSSYLNRSISFYDYMESVNDDNAVTSYSYYLFINKKDDIPKLFDLVRELSSREDNDKLVIEATSYDVFTTYSEFMSTFSSALYVFTIIAFLGVNFIIGIIALSSFIERKKESAILSALGARDSSISAIFLEENYLIIIGAILVASLLSIPLMSLLNDFFYSKFLLANLINVPFESFLGIKYIFIPLVLLIALLVASLFILIPLSIYKSRSISEELRDE